MRTKKVLLRLLLCLFFICLGSQFSQGQTANILFEEAYWYDLLQKAKNENKFVFVAVHTPYCAPCKRMEKQVFSNSHVATFYNLNFINYKVDYGAKSFAHFNSLLNNKIAVLPTHFYFDPNGKLMETASGELNATELFLIGKKVIDRSTTRHYTHGRPVNAPELYELQQKFERGNYTPASLKKLAYLLKRNHKPYDKVVNTYVASQGEQMYTEYNRQFIFDFSISIRNKCADLLIQDIAYFKRFFGAKNVNERVKMAVYNAVMTAAEEHNGHLFTKAVDMVRQAEIPDTDQFIFEVSCIFYQLTEDQRNYSRVVSDYVNAKPISDPRLLNELALNYYYFINNKRLLEDALLWVRRSIAIESESYNHQTLALLLSKLGKRNEAQRAAADALYIARLRGEDLSKSQWVMQQLK